MIFQKIHSKSAAILTFFRAKTWKKEHFFEYTARTPSKESKQTSDNVAGFYNLTLPIMKSDEIFNVILWLEI